MAMNANYFDLPLNMDRVCRVCLTESTNLSPIFCSGQQVDTNFSDLSQKIQICGSIDVHEQDGLPSLICDVCIYKASVAYEFRQQCQHSDARLRLFYNKPARTNIMDSETQTEPQTRVIITKAAANPQQIYFIKEELQTSSNNPHEYPPAEETFINQPVEPQEQHHPVLSENQLNINEEPKLYECNFGFTSLKENGKDSEVVAEEIVPHEGTVGIGVEHVQEGMSIPQEIPVSETAEIILNSQCSEVIEKVPETTDNPTLAEEYLNGSIELNSSEVLEDHQVPQKRTPARKAKIQTNNGTSTYSEEDDEMDNDFYDPSSDSQDSEELKFKCKVCSKRYATHKGLKKHSLVHEKKHKCNICFKLFYKEENLEKHKKIHTSKPHACQLCHASFSKSQSLVRHLKSHTDKVNDIIKQINTTGVDNEDVKISKKELKDEEDSDDDDRNPQQQNHDSSLNDDFQDPPGLFKCDICNQYCSSMKNLKRHSLLHGEKKYSCTVCKKWFFRPDTLKKHAEKHGHGLLDNLMDDNKLYDDSDDDDNQFHNSGQRDNNVIKKEEDNNDDEDANGEYKCQHCDKIMATKKGLRRHVSMHKPKAEPVTCEICKKVCASQARLILHQKTHNKPKEKVPREYLCHICSKVYPSNSSLTYHMRTHTGIKPHVCKTCNSGFTTTTSLANHIRIHTGDKPFVCHVCSAAFAVSSAFRRHLTRHTGEANYLCKTCGKAFKRLSTLKEHTYTHSGEKPYVCKTCGAAYSHSGSLFAHQKRCRAQYGEMTVVEDHHHNVAHHIHVNNVQSAVRSLAVIGQMF